MARRIPKGAKDYSRILVTEDEGATVTITSPLFEVFDNADSSIQAEASATLRNNGTAAVEVYGLVDTTASGFVDGEWVKVKFTITIDDVLLFGFDPVAIKEEKL
jgi:hypothetical protein